MKKGIVISLGISHKNGRTVLGTGAKVTENDVHNWARLVKDGHIKVDEFDESKPISKMNKAELEGICAKLEIELEGSETNKEKVALIESKLLVNKCTELEIELEGSETDEELTAKIEEVEKSE